jgi:hypothetical protein
MVIGEVEGNGDTWVYLRLGNAGSWGQALELVVQGLLGSLILAVS